jgi:surfeit locus 1 family protein
VTATARRLLWPSLMTACMMVVLLGLGSWQVKRLFWKEALLAQIEHAESADPVPLPPRPSRTELSPFMKVSATGTFLPGEAALYGAEVRTTASGPSMGARMIEPMRQTNGDVILVDRGWVPLSRPGPIEQPEGVVTVSGYIRPGDSEHWFSARDDPPARRFFTLDPKAIGAAVGQPDVQPFILVMLAAPTASDAELGADSRTPPGSSPRSGASEKQWPEPAQHLPRPPNSHLSYAITWYGLAMALLAIFIVWARKGPLA